MYTLFSIKLAILCMVSLQRIARTIPFKESSNLCTIKREVAWSFLQISVVFKLSVVVSYLAFSILPEVFRFLSLNWPWLWISSHQNLNFLNNWNGQVDKTEGCHTWGPKFKSGHGQVLLEWKINFKIADQLTSDFRF